MRLSKQRRDVFKDIDAADTSRVKARIKNTKPPKIDQLIEALSKAAKAGVTIKEVIDRNMGMREADQ